MTLMPLAKVLSKDEKFTKLQELGYLLDINKLDSYLSSVKDNKSAEPNSSFWADKRVLITGISGFVGSHLTELLLAHNAKIWGVVRKHADPRYPNIEHLRKKINILHCDLTEQAGIEEIIRNVDPHVIYHLAAESFVPMSLAEPKRVYFNNVECTWNVFIAARKYCNSLEALHVACTSEQYGYVKSFDELPIKEENPLRPLTPYALSKVDTEKIAKLYYDVYDVPSVITRAFNHEGSKRGHKFFTSVIARTIVRCLLKNEKRVIIGNPNSIRDFTHVRDMVNAYMLAVEKIDRGEPYNICSEVSISTGDYAQLAVNNFGVRAEIYVDTDRLRPYERGKAFLDGFVANCSKFKEKTGWAPTFSILDIMKDGVEFYTQQPELLELEI